jgi:hypothetical protein
MKNLVQNKAPKKKIHVVSERSEDGLSPHALIFISMFLAKMDFFESRGP